MLNIAVLQGRLVADPELMHTPNDVAVTNFTVAVDRAYVKQGEERQADFIDIVAWRNTAEFVCRYFRKGQMIAVQGSIQTRSYTDSQGIKRKAFEIVAANVHFSGDKKDSSGGDPLHRGPEPDESVRSAAVGFEYKPVTRMPNVEVDGYDAFTSDDDLPF